MLTMGKLTSLSLFYHLEKRGDNKTCPIVLLWGLKDVLHAPWWTLSSIYLYHDCIQDALLLGHLSLSTVPCVYEAVTSQGSPLSLHRHIRDTYLLSGTQQKITKHTQTQWVKQLKWQLTSVSPNHSRPWGLCSSVARRPEIHPYLLLQVFRFCNSPHLRVSHIFLLPCNISRTLTPLMVIYISTSLKNGVCHCIQVPSNELSISQTLRAGLSPGALRPSAFYHPEKCSVAMKNRSFYRVWEKQEWLDIFPYPGMADQWYSHRCTI